MAVKNTEKFLRDMRSFMEREYKRGALDKFSTIVTMTDKGFGEGFKQGYNTIQSQREEGNRVEISNKEFLDIGGACVDAVAQWALRARTQGHVLEYIPGKLLRYRASRDLKTPYTQAKNKGVQLLNKKLRDAGKKELGKADKSAGISARGSEVGLVKSTVHRAHQGVTTVGAAQVSAALNFLDQTRSFAGFATSEEAREISDILKEIKATFTTSGTKSGSRLSEVKLNEDLSVEIFVLPQSANEAGAEPYDFKRLMPKLQTAITRYVERQNIEGMPGSDSIEEDARKRIEYAIVAELSGTKNAKLKGTSKKPRGRAKKSVGTNIKYPKKTTKGSTKKAIAASRTARKPKAKRSDINLAQLLGLFNSKITGTVAANMGPPGLTNQTGRFASSVRVTDVTVTPQGFPSVGYTYQKNPYQTFERGYQQGTPDYDPRDLIDKSIREIAANMALGRLYTRRL